jgi:hypothetical protein
MIFIAITHAKIVLMDVILMEYVIIKHIVKKIYFMGKNVINHVQILIQIAKHAIEMKNAYLVMILDFMIFIVIYHVKIVLMDVILMGYAIIKRIVKKIYFMGKNVINHVQTLIQIVKLVIEMKNVYLVKI